LSIKLCNNGNIIRIQGMSNYCKIYFADKQYPLTVTKLLHWFEEHLPAEVFWRTHKTHLINSNYIDKMHTAHNPYLLLINGEIITISRRRAPMFKKWGNERMAKFWIYGCLKRLTP